MIQALSLLILVIAVSPFVYYLLAIYGSYRFFARGNPYAEAAEYTPAISNLKPVKGLDEDAYENFASLCRQDYPEYELLFCVDADCAPVISILDRLKADFPERSIRVLLGSGRVAPNDKTAKLARLVAEAKHDVIVINDSDVRARPDYFRTVVKPLGTPGIGAVTLPYVPLSERTFADRLQSVGMFSDFYAGIFVARELDGIKFALGPTVATKRSELAKFGGYESIQDRPGDDLLIGRLIAESGARVELLPYTVETVADFASLKELLHKRLRWMIVMRYMRPVGHLGLLFTQGLPWCAIAALVAPSLRTGIAYFFIYLGLRIAMTWVIGGWGLKRESITGKFWLIPLWDAMAFCIWIASFTRRSVRWRGDDYYIQKGRLIPVNSFAEEPM